MIKEKKINFNEIDTVLVVGSAYSIYFYLSLVDTKVERTLLVCAEGVPNKIVNKFNNRIVFNELRPGLLKFIDFSKVITLFFWLRCKFFKKIDNIDFYGVDHLFYSPILKLPKNYTLIEDGLINYIFPNKKNPFIYRLLLGKQFGTSNKCKVIYLSGLRNLPDSIKDKVYILKPTLTEESKKVFEIGNEVNVSEKSVILLTQPLSEDCIISEYEKIAIYKKLLSDYVDEKVKIYIKPHPREVTKYEVEFINSTIIGKEVPFEIVSSIYPSEITLLTLFSSSIYQNKFDRNIIAGTRGILALEERFGIIEEEIVE